MSNAFYNIQDGIKVSSIIHLLVDKDDWRVVEHLDHFSWIYDRMPPKMKAIIDFKMTGMENKEVWKLLDISKVHFYRLLREAKSRLLRAEHIL